MKYAYLIVLSGQGDTYGAIVDQDVWDWINSPYEGERNELWYAPEKVKHAVIEEAVNACDVPEVYVTSGSWDNYRALVVVSHPAACLFSHFGDWSAARDAEDWAKENDYRIVATYHGCVY